MKSVLISIRPQWCEKICHVIGKEEAGKPIYEKRIEVRKSAPKEVPFKAYIYCTKANKKYQTICGCMVINTDELYRLPNGKIKHDWSGELMCCNGEYTRDNFLNGKVIGEFVCDEIEELHEWELSPQGKFADFERERLENFLTAACLSEEEVVRYRENLPYFKPLYGWHISDLKIYDKPKELSEFKTPPCEKPDCGGCKYRVVINTPETYEIDCFVVNGREITRPPQSWQYVEELK